MADKKTILIVGQMDQRFVGDYSSNPFLYFPMPLADLKGANLRFERTELGIEEAIEARKTADAIVVAGGEILNEPDRAEDIEFWTDQPVPLIAWGAGTSHAHAAKPEPEELQQLKSFALIGLRDFETGFPWVPCASCMHPLFNESSEGKGVAFCLTQELRASPEALAAIVAEAPDAPITYSDHPLEEQIEVLRKAEIVVTNSYHSAYWATLLGKRVIAVGGERCMSGLKHPPSVADGSFWKASTDRTIRYPEALEECREANIDFARRAEGVVGRSNRNVPYVRNPVAERGAEVETTPPQSPLIKRIVVPRVVHFVFGLSPDFGGKPFNLMHQIAIRSAIDRIKPEEIFFHCRHIPETPLFDSVRNQMTLIQLPSVQGDVPKHFAHRADIIRLQALCEQGGIYLDLDTITVESFDPLLVHQFTLGAQGREKLDGLCNAVILAAPQNPDIKNWLDAYARFSDQWDLFSVRLPYVMWRSRRWDVHVEPYDSFHWPTWRPEGLEAMFERDILFPNAICHHLWETLSYPRYFSGGNEQIAAMLKSGKSTYSRLARPYLT